MSQILTALVLVSLLFLVLYLYLTRNFNHWAKKGVLSIPNPYPIVGNLLQVFRFKKAIGAHFAEMYMWNQDIPMVGFYILDEPALLLRCPDLIKQIYVKDFAKFNNRNVSINPKCDKRAGLMLFLLKNPEWRHTRSKLTPMFTAVKLKGMFPLLIEVGDDLSNYLSASIKSEDEIEARELCAKFTTDITISCFYGIQAKSFESENSLFRNWGRRLLEPKFGTCLKQALCFLAPNVAEFFKFTFFEQEDYDVLTQQFWGMFQERKSSDRFRNDCLDLFIKYEGGQGREDGGMQFDKDWILSQALILFIAGFETGSSIMSYTLYELAKNLELQRKLRDEIKSKFSSSADVTFEAIEELKYMNMVVSESLRKYPVTHFLDRICVEDYQIPDTNIVIEKGTPVILPLFGLHYDPKYFPDPEKFDPERFNEVNRALLPSTLLCPFGVGPRDCIGKRLGYIIVAYGLTRVLMEFEVSPTAKTPKQAKPDPETLLLGVVGGLPLKFSKIS